MSFAEHNSEELGGRIVFNYITTEEIGIFRVYSCSCQGDQCNSTKIDGLMILGQFIYLAQGWVIQFLILKKTNISAGSKTIAWYSISTYDKHK